MRDETKLSDVILLCANCWMIHRSAPWLTPDDLCEVLTNQVVAESDPRRVRSLLALDSLTGHGNTVPNLLIAVNRRLGRSCSDTKS